MNEDEDNIVKLRLENTHLKGELKNAQLQKELELEKIKAQNIEIKGKTELEIKRLEWELQQLKDKMLEKELELQQLELEKELELQQLKGKMEHEKELELQQLKGKMEHEKELLKIKFKAEIENHARDNWHYIKKLQKLDLRVFINKFEYIHCPGEEYRSTRFRKYIEKNKDLLYLWGFTPIEFMRVFDDFYDSLNKSAHPVFEIGKEVVIPENFLNNCQLRVLGFLWEKYPLPLKLFKLKTEDSSVKTLNDFRKRENRKRKLD